MRCFARASAGVCGCAYIAERLECAVCAHAHRADVNAHLWMCVYVRILVGVRIGPLYAHVYLWVCV
jgi:hypothetical protein